MNEGYEKIYCNLVVISVRLEFITISLGFTMKWGGFFGIKIYK